MKKRNWLFVVLSVAGLVLFVLYRRRKNDVPEPLTIATPSKRIKTILPESAIMKINPPTVQNWFNGLVLPKEPAPVQSPLFPYVDQSKLPTSAPQKYVPTPQSNPETLVNTNPPIQIKSIQTTDYARMKTASKPLGISRMR